MKILLLFLVFCLLAWVDVSGQSKKLSYSLSDQPIRLLFREISKQCGYNIVFSDDLISDSILVSGEFKQVPVSQVLGSVLRDKGFFYRMLSEKMIVIGLIEHPLSLSATDRTMMRGGVFDSEGTPIAFSTIALLENGVQVGGTIGLEGGTFDFSCTLNTEKRYALRLTCIGYEALMVSFRISDFGPQDKDFGHLILRPKANFLKEVKVTGSQPLIEMNGSNIVFNVSASLLAQGSNALELLSRAPGVTVGTNNSISLNGKAGVAILIDGRLTYLSGNELAELLKSMSSSSIRSIEIINSPGAKYDAAGTAGIINVKTQRATSEGFSAGLTSGLGYGVYLRNNQDLSFSLRRDRWNIFGNYSHFLGNYSYLYGADRLQENMFYNSFTDDIDKRKKMGSRLGADFSINKKNTVGILLNGNFLFGGGITDTRTEMGAAGSPKIDQVLTAINDYYYQQTQRYNINLNYKYEDSLGRSLNVDADYGDFTKGAGNLQSNAYMAADNTLISDNLYRSVNAIDISLKAIKVDYSANLWKGKVETGFKYSAVTSDNDSRFLELQNGEEILDPSRSNHFVYTESIKSAYLSFKRPAGKWQFEGGLRVENSRSSGKLDSRTPVSGNELGTNRRYTNFFPSVSISLKPAKSHDFSLSYSKRIDRPAYQNLNPFIYLLDELSYWQGNPFLRPQLSHRMLLQYAYKSSTILGLSYTRVSDFSVEVTDTVGLSRIVMVPRNLGVQNVLSLSLNQTISPFNWWNINFNGTIFRLNNNIDFGNGRKLELKQTAARLSLQQTFKLPLTLSGEVAGFLNSRRLVGANQFVGTTSQVDLGLQRSFLGKKATVRFIFSDIYKGTRANSVQTIAGLYIHNYSYFETRQIKLNFSYRFNSGSSKNPRTRTSALDAENGRIK